MVPWGLNVLGNIGWSNVVYNKCSVIGFLFLALDHPVRTNFVFRKDLGNIFLMRYIRILNNFLCFFHIFILYLIFLYYLLFIILFMAKSEAYFSQIGVWDGFFVKTFNGCKLLAVSVESSILHVCLCSEYIFVNVLLSCFLMYVFFLCLL